jgi:hypothetical protein
VIIDNGNFVRVVSGPLENNPPLIPFTINDPNRIKAPQLASGFLRPVRWRYRQILQPRSGVDRLQLSLGSICETRKRFDDLILKQVLGLLISEGLD